MTYPNEIYSQSESLKVCHEREVMLIDDLLRLLDASPPSRQSLLTTVDQLLCLLSRQFQLASRGGYLTEVTQLRPNWHREVQSLGVANMDCITSLNEIRDRLEKSRPSPTIETNQGGEIDAWVRSLATNRGNESRLLQAAFSIDMGGEA